MELTGILSGTGAKMKAEVLEDQVRFRGAWKGDVPFEEIVAEARGTLLVLTFRGMTVEVGAGSRAPQLAAKVRSPPSRADRMGLPAGATIALAGPLDAAFRAEAAARGTLVPGVPKAPVDVLVLAAPDTAQLGAVAKVAPLVGPAGTLWVVVPAAAVPATKVAAAGKEAGLRAGDPVRFAEGLVAIPLRR